MFSAAPEACIKWSGVEYITPSVAVLSMLEIIQRILFIEIISKHNDEINVCSMNSIRFTFIYFIPVVTTEFLKEFKTLFSNSCL